MDLQLKGKRALVTGGSSGIGAAVALELAAEGVSVVVQGRDADKAAGVARQVEALGAAAVVALGDLTRDAEADAVADAALAAFGGIDILVNSAGGVVRSDNPEWEDVSSEEWLTSFNLNVVSVVRLAKRLAPAMAERGWGRIINISSIGGGQWSGRLHDYGSAKAALEHLTGNLSKTLAPRGVTVNAVIPGTVMTPQAERWIATLRRQHGWPDDLAENERTYTREFSPQPVPRLGRPAEIAAAVAFLASPRSDYTTGAMLRVDGGAAKSR
jgi:NAD(P)-dependent dehydrogenase (short-subunit alcohol dehydrogenase family)